ncbi:50S ribosomal protein L17 [Candidatus Saccharibacteria bacterium]|nr:50S ribosomal protein L17 [Candidatus Saccharibacteria bacterium]
MHRHGYKGRKLGREAGQRLALMRSLTVALIQHGEITTTLAKAKELRRSFEKLVTLAKRGDLHSRRLLTSRIGNLQAANALMDTIVKDVKRDSGYLRITREGFRRGDNAEMARIAFVDSISAYTTDASETPKAAPAEKTSGAKATKKEKK